MHKLLIVLLFATITTIAAFDVKADDLTRMIEENLAALGYDTGEVDGESNTMTAIAISQYQSENGLDVTGEASPQLAGILAADVKQQGTSEPMAADAQPDAAGSVEAPDSATAEAEAQALQAAQQACLQEKIAAAEQAKKKKKRFGKLLKSVAGTVGRFGGSDLAKAAGDVYATTATVEDVAATAEALGLTEQDVTDCQNPAG